MSLLAVQRNGRDQSNNTAAKLRAGIASLEALSAINQTIDAVLGQGIIGRGGSIDNDGQVAIEGGLAAEVGAVIDICAFRRVDGGGERRSAVSHETVEPERTEERVDEVELGGSWEGEGGGEEGEEEDDRGEELHFCSGQGNE